MSAAPRQADDHDAHVLAWLVVGRKRPRRTDEELGWEKARHYVDTALHDLCVQQCDAAMQMLGLLSFVLHNGSPSAWMDKFDDETRAALGRYRAARQHGATRLAREWVREEFLRVKPAKKAQFAYEYMPKVRERFGLEVLDQTISKVWLKGL